MSRRAVFQALMVVVAIVVAADLTIQRMALRSVPRQLIRSIDSAPPTIDVLGIGNSLMAAGFDPPTVEETFLKSGRPCAAVNGGLGATGVIEHLALTRLALRRHHVKTLVYGFFDQQMAVDLAKSNSDLIGNRNMLYYQEPQLTAQYAHFDPLDRLTFQVYRRSALLRERGSIWGSVEKMRRAMASFGMPQEETNRFGRRADFTLLEASDPQSFSLACEGAMRSGELLSAPVQAMLRQARDHGAKVIVLEMPMHPSHLKDFYSQPIWEKFRASTKAAVEGAGGTYLNASAWISGADLFDDNLHLSKAGAREFSRLLAEDLMRQGN